MKKLIICLFILLAVMSNLVSCTTIADSVENVGENNKISEINADNTVKAYVGTEIFSESLDPIKGAMSHGYSFTNSSLLTVNPSSQYIGELATAWTVSEDALTYTFEIRQGVKFSDGSDMTADDVVFTYEKIKKNQAENQNVDLTYLSAVQSVGKYAVEFTLSQPYSPFLDITATIGIVPKDLYDSNVFGQYPVGTGPWKVVQYDANQQIILEPNEYFYNGIPEIERITLVCLDDETALSAAHSGTLDVVMVNSDYAAEQVEGMTMIPLETMDIRMVSLPVQPRLEQNGIISGNDVTSDINVRKALSIGINRTEIIDNALGGIGVPAMGFTDNLIWAASESFEDGRISEAVKLLEEAGWVDSDGDGVREKDGIKCEFDIFTAADRYSLAVALGENAVELGIKINVHSSSWDEIASNMRSQGVMWGWGQYNPTVIRSLFYAPSNGSEGYDNVVGYVSPEVNGLIDEAIDATNQENIVDLWQKVQKLSNEDCPYLYLVNIQHSYFVSDCLDISLDTQIPHPHGHGMPIICNMKDWKFK